MELEEFRQHLIQDVHARAAADENFTLASFVQVAAEHLADAGEVADFQGCHYRGPGTRQRSIWLDGYSFDDVDDSVRLLVADFRGQAEMPTLTQTEGERLVGRVRAFVDDAMRGALGDIEVSAEAYQFAAHLREREHFISRFRIFLVTDCVLSSRVKDWPEGEILGKPVEYHIWDIGRFHRAFESKSGRDDLDIDFTAYLHDGIPCLEASADASQFSAYLCIVPGTVLAKMYDEFGSRLLEGNVRSFLSARGKINKGIRNTVLNQPAMFFAFNNGIAATATEVRTGKKDAGLRLLGAKEFQIVNGGQTTASISIAAKNDKASLDGVFVQLKLCVVPPAESGEVIPLIARYANSQNKVGDADFFSNHEFHRRMEEMSRRLLAPAHGGAQYETQWFYERARGQYLTEQARLTRAAEKNRFLVRFPRNQLITKTDLAKVENSWLEKPHVVSLGAQKNFLKFAEYISERWDRSDAEFNEEYFRRVVARTILFRTIEKLAAKGGFRANVVTYSIAKLASMIHDAQPKRELNFEMIWRKQELSPALIHQLGTVSAAVLEIITTPPEGTRNVTEWCKKELCWKRIQALAIKLRTDFSRELVDFDEDRTAKKDGRAQQKADNKINAQIEVVGLGEQYWSAIATWARPKRLLTEDDESC